MEEYTAVLTQELSDKNGYILRLLQENERLRAELDAFHKLKLIPSVEYPAGFDAIKSPATTSNVESSAKTNDGESPVRTNDHHIDEDELDEACDVTDQAQRSNEPRARRRYLGPSASDDEEPIPVPKKEKCADAGTTSAKVDSATTASSARTQASAAGTKRKRPSDTLILVESIEDGSDSLERSKVSSDLPQPGTEARSTKKARQAPPYKPLSKEPLPRPEWTTPPRQPNSTFMLPGIATAPQKPNRPQETLSVRQAPLAETTPTKQSLPTRRAPPKKPDPPEKTAAPIKSSKDSTAETKSLYAETTPFDFKFIVSYADVENADAEEIEFHDSAALVGEILTFWPKLKQLREIWEEQAGAAWYWELQENQESRQRGRRFCVTRKLAKQRTRWRESDDGRYACLDCASDIRPCFIWVRGESGEEDEEKDEEKDEEEDEEHAGEFWCLPVHPEDRRCEVREEKEICTWINEGESSDDESDSDEDDGGSDSSGEMDVYKPESNSSEETGTGESSSEDNGNESDDDGDL